MNIKKSTLKMIIGAVILALVVCVIILMVKAYAPIPDETEAFIRGIGQLV